MRQTAFDAASSPSRIILTITELTRRIRLTLDDGFSDIWVAGEISSLRSAPSGHSYFVLKDADAQLAAVLFRGAAAKLPFRPEEGMEVLARGRVGLYEVRGALQFYVDAIEPRGVGSLQLAIEQLKEKLAAEGLFDSSRKRPLPYLPTTVGIVTALRGAAIHDMLVTLRRRSPGVRIVIRPAFVQGREAPDDLVAALADLAADGDIDCCIVGRGGGSLEDLMAFNDERVARAIAAAPFPVISAVGHEVDFTIADLVADVRAATPTAAAARIAPDTGEIQAVLATQVQRLASGMRRQILRQRQHLAAMRRQLRDPRAVLKVLQQRVDELSERGTRAIAVRIDRARARLGQFGEQLHALSPLAVLARGYALVRMQPDAALVRDSAQLHIGATARIQFHSGTALVRVEDLDHGKET